MEMVFWTENDIGIGHKRLSIIDLSDAGVQPHVSVEIKDMLFHIMGRFIIF